MTGKRVDANHAEIRDGLRQCGYQVIDTHTLGVGFPDLLAVSRTRVIVLLEVKTPTGKLNQVEQDFHRDFRGPLAVVRSAEEALNVMYYYDGFQVETE